MHRDREHRDIFGLVLGAISVFGLTFGLIFGFIFSFPTIFGLIFGFGTIWGALSFLLLVDRHAQDHTTMPEVSLDDLLFYSSLGIFSNRS